MRATCASLRNKWEYGGRERSYLAPNARRQREFVGVFAVYGAAGDQAARASLRRSLRCYAGLYRRVGLPLLHRGLLLQPIFLKDKSTDTVTHAFRVFLAVIKPLREKHGEPGALRTDNGTELVNEPFANLLAKHGIRREFISVDGPKRNGCMERRIALVKKRARAVWLGFPRLFPDVRLPSRVMHYSAVWPEVWTWMSENTNNTSRVDGQDKRCPEEKLYGKRLRKQLLPFLMPGHRTRGSGPK